MNVKDKLGLLGATILTLGIGGVVTPAFAQDAPTAEEGDVIVVTGSRLRRETFESPNPTFQVGSQQMDASQVSNTIDALEDIPLIGIGVNNRGTQGQNGDSFAFPDVLDLGTQRTLTLLNGRRVVAGNQGTVFVPGNASGAQVDLSMINPQIIDRVEVLAGTGGAIYGADAVAGVVNIITKDDYEGFDLRGQASFPEIGEGNSYRLSGLAGFNLLEDRLNITIGMDYFSQDVIVSSTDTAQLYGGSLATNQLDAATRSTAAFSIASALTTLGGGGALPSVFTPTATNGVPSTYLGPFSLANSVMNINGVLTTGQNYSGGFGTTTSLVPAGFVTPLLARSGTTAATATTLDPLGYASFAPNALTAAQDTGPMRLQIFQSFGSTGAQDASFAALTAAQQGALVLQLLQRNRMTPYEYYAANPGLDPRLFMGTFGSLGSSAPNGWLPTVNSSTVAGVTAAQAQLFPRYAVPLQFNSSGQLVAYNVGNIAPPLQAQANTVFGGEGYDPFALGFSQVQAGTERASFSLMGNYEITDWLRTRTEVLYSNATFDQIQGVSTNAAGGNAQAGTLAVPIFIDQNPFFGASNVNQINTMVANGMVLPAAIGGQRVMYMGRALSDIFGGAGLESTAEVETYRVAQVLEGDFSIFDRDFYWDVAAIYGRSEVYNNRVDVGDIEFALATDVIDPDGAGPLGPACRQTALGIRESIAIRNPGTVAVLNAFGLTPTQDQINRCVPLNLFGDGASSAAAREYVQVDATTHALNTQEVYSASVGGEIFRLPAGAVSLGLNYEYRREQAEFEPVRGLAFGSGRTALQGRGNGDLMFNEYGYEVLIPIFGEGFNFPLMESLEFQYAFRIVEREQESDTALSTGEGTEDDTFNYSINWKPFEDLTIRGARSRTVRSASLVELVGPFTIAFTTPTNAYHPCSTLNIDTGPSGVQRRANCVASVLNPALGIVGTAGNPDGVGNQIVTQAGATHFLAQFTAAGLSAQTRSAVAQGNPNLANEEGNAYTYGVTYEPSWAPRLVIAADFFSVDMINEIGLIGPYGGSGSAGAFMGICYDSATFPEAPVGGINACDQFLFGVNGGGGNFIIPGGVNPLTGNASFAGVLGGTPAINNTQFESTMAAFNNINLGGRQFRGVNVEVRYNFALSEVPFLGGAMEGWGDMFLRTTLFHNQRYDVYADSNFQFLADRQVGEHPGTGQAEYEFRTDFRHRLGPFDHTLQWFWNPATVTNITTSKAVYPDQTLSFRADDFSYFNYQAAYDITDAFTLRLVVNNLTDTEEPRGQYGLTNQFDGGVGREWVVGFQARF
jgi:outer membrane receptor protein involved in Fe transport